MFDGDDVSLGVPEPEGDVVTDADAELLGVPVLDVVWLRVPVEVWLAVSVPVSVSEGV